MTAIAALSNEMTFVLSDRVRFATATLSVTCAIACSGCLPQSADTLNRASALFQAGRYNEAATEYRNVIAEDPSWAAGHLGLGNALWELGDREEALKAYREAVRLSPNWIEPHVSLGDALVEIGRWSEALGVLQNARTIAPDDARAHILLGITLTHMGEYSSAVTEFEAAVRLCQECFDERASMAFSKAKAARRN